MKRLYVFALAAFAACAVVACDDGGLQVPMSSGFDSSTPPVHLSHPVLYDLPLCHVLAPALRGRPGVVYTVAGDEGLYAISLMKKDIVCVDDEQGILESGIIPMAAMEPLEDCDLCDGTPLPAVVPPLRNY